MQPSTEVLFETHYVADEKTAKEMTKVCVLNMITSLPSWIGLLILSFVPVLLGLSGGYRNTRRAGSTFANGHPATNKTFGDYLTTYIATAVLLLCAAVVAWIIYYFRARKDMRSAFPVGGKITLRFDSDGFDQEYPNVRGRLLYSGVKNVFRRGDAVVIRRPFGRPTLVAPKELLTDGAYEYLVSKTAKPKKN